MYKQLVHEITATFKKISDEIIEIQHSLEDDHSNIAALIGKIQDEERVKLEAVCAFCSSIVMIERYILCKF